MKKRVLSLILAVVMVLCLVPAISMVSFAAEEDYSILPDDANKAHFLSLVEAYKDDVEIPTAAVINAKLSGYLELNKEMTIDEQAEIVAKAIRIYAPTDDLHKENIQIIAEYITSNPIPEGAAQRDYAKALATKLVFANGTDNTEGYRLYAARNTANYYAWTAVSASGVTTTVDEKLAPAWAEAIYAAGVRVYGVEDTQDAQTACVAAAINEIITKNDIKTIEGRGTQNCGDNVFTPLANTVHFVTSITKSGNGNTDGVGGGNTGPWTHVSSGMEQVVKQMNYGTHKVADFYLNFSDVATTGEAAEFKAILDYYFAPGAGNYGYYEDLWYDDGHLVYFVDTANLNNPYATSTNQNEDDQTAVAPSHFARFIKTASATSKGSTLDKRLRPHVKVVGGYEIGRYFTIGTNRTETLTTEVNQAGFLRVHVDNLWAEGNYGFGRESAIYLGYSYSYEQTYLELTGHDANANGSTQYNDYNYFNDNGITYKADENGYYGGYTMEFAMRLDKEYWSNPYYNNFANATASKTYAPDLYGSNVGYRLLGATTDGNNRYDVSGAIIHLGSKWDETLNNGAGGYVMSYETVGTGFGNEGGLNTFKQKKYAGALGDYMSITVSAGYIVPEQQITMTTRLNVNGTESYDKVGVDGGYQYADTSNEITLYPNMKNTKRSLNYGSADSQVHRCIIMQDKLMSNFRAYDCMLTDEQVASNRVADLFYEKGVNLKAYNTLSDAKRDAVNSHFSDANFDTVTKSDIEAFISELSKPADARVYDDDYKEYAHLWYNDGHLMAFIDLMNITDAERGDATKFATDEQYIKDGYRLINGNSHHGSFDGENYHSFVRIVGGKNAGKWLPIFSRYGGVSGGTITDYKFPTVEGGFTDFGSMMAYFNAGLHTGILLTHPYDDATVGTKFRAPINETVAESYFLPEENGGNSFTVDSSAYIATPSVSYNWSVFVTAFTSTQSPDTESVFEGTRNHPNKHTQNYGVFLAGEYDSNAVNLKNFANGYIGYFGGFSSKSNINCSVHFASTITYQSSNTFLSSYSVIVDHPTNGNKVESRTASHPKATEAFDGYPSYGASANMNTVVANLANNNYYYYVRTYDVALTSQQMMQNHFADLMYYNRIDTAKYDALNENDKMTLWAWATDIQLSDANSKALIEDKIDAIANAETGIINFKGFQARVSKNVGIRSIFYLDQSAIADAGVTVKAYGAIVSAALAGVDFDDLVINYNAGNGEVSVSSNFLATKSTDTDFKTIGDAEKAYILRTSENLNDYTMFAYTMNYINGSIDEEGNITGTNMIEEKKDTEMFFRAFAVVEYKGVTYIHYVDGASENYDNSSVSLAEVSEYYAAYNNGEFANNACIKAVVGNGDEE